MIYGIVVLSVTFNATAQLLLRMAMVDFNTTSPSQPLVSRMLVLGFSPPLMGGLVLFGFSILAWLVVLSRLPVSIAYPMASLGYVMAALLGVVFLREPVHVLQIVGIVVICLGVGLIARSAVP
ncbi:MAG: EamA family transporter [Acidocella sp.]|uniref:EamA family transporter n=1 Tax=Acidocella sp. TaxID=50710 RepID=UPI003FD846BE